MPYIGSDGNLVQQKPFGTTILDYFWGAVNFVSFFFRSLLHLDQPTSSQTRGRYGNGARAPGMPGRRIGGIRSSGGVAPPPCVGSS